MMAAARLLPPFLPLETIYSILVSIRASLESSAPTKPTGTPIMALAFNRPTSFISIALYRAVGAFPKINILSQLSLAAISTAAIDLVILLALARSIVSWSAIKHL